MLAEAIPHRRTGASSRARCFMCIAAVMLACATDDVESPASGPDGATGAVSSTQVDAGLCPAPAANTALGYPEVWARSPEAGDCCRYESFAAAPSAWPHFQTEALCQDSCHCSAVEGFSEEYGWYETDRSSLECRCSAETCPTTVAEAEQLMCSRSLPAVRREGCGMVMIDHSNGATGEAWIFERPLASADAGGAGERLTGATEFSDVPFGPCGAYEWLAGRRFECDAVTECQLCGDEAGLSSLPPCE